MNLKQIWCHLKSIGFHYEFVYDENHLDCYCARCRYYLFSEYDFIPSLKKMRNDWKMWWETKE